MANLAIIGHATRGKEVIEILKMLGGKTSIVLTGGLICNAYYINSNGFFIDYKHRSEFNNDIVYSLEEFLEKFPYKVGDKVKVCGDNLGVIISMRWEIDYVVYKVKLSENGYETSKHSENLQPYKEETMDRKYNVETYLKVWKETEKGLEVLVNDRFELKEDNGKFYIIKKQPQYPKTYEECAQILLERASIRNDIGHKGDLLIALQRLLVCRDAYWKIAGEQMGLGKPWEQDYDDRCFIIANNDGNIHTYEYHGSNNVVLAFPTAEIRDAFYENFKDLIESCKELL
jgi:hypothetical protein